MQTDGEFQHGQGVKAEGMTAGVGQQAIAASPITGPVRAVGRTHQAAGGGQGRGRQAPQPVHLGELHQQRVMSNDEFRVIGELVRAREKALATQRVSLNEATRRAEQDEHEQEALALENRLRLARGLEPLTRLPGQEDEEDLGTEAETEDEEDILSDVLLDEGARILGDVIATHLGTQPVMAASSRSDR